ncbi:unnamed protein product [Calypogeia fissa]
MATAEKPAPTQVAGPPAKQAEAPPVMNQLSLEDGKTENAIVPHESSKQDAGALAVVESPSKEKLMNDQELSRSAPQTPPETPEKKSKISPGKRGSNLKAEAFAVAHSKRVEHEAEAYIEAEVRKAEAEAEKKKAIAEKEKMKEEANAQELLKKEEVRADLTVHNAVLKADKIVEQAKQKGVLIKANAKELSEKHIAEAITVCERTKAAAEEAKEKKMAEIKDKAETMIASGELIPSDNSKGFGQRMKESLICH